MGQKAEISPMEIIDKNGEHLTIIYRGKKYNRLQHSRWEEYLPPNNYPPTIIVYDHSFVSHLERAFNHHFNGKTIEKVCVIKIY